MLIAGGGLIDEDMDEGCYLEDGVVYRALTAEERDALLASDTGSECTEEDLLADEELRHQFLRLPGRDGCVVRKRFDTRSYTWHENGSSKDSMKKLLLDIELMKGEFQ